MNEHTSKQEGNCELPPMPEKETEQRGFIENVDSFPEEKMTFPIAQGPYQPTWQSIAEHTVPEWWNEAKFGVFIHWGPQAAGRSGDWYARRLYEEDETDYKNHLSNYGHPSEVGYKDVLHQWQPDQWDPKALVEAFQDAGFRYALVVGVHHDNYDLWNSQYHPWNSVNVGPKQDFLAGWKRELESAGMHFGVAFHHEYTWWWWQTAFGADSRGSRAGIPYDGNLTLSDGKGKWWEGLDPRRLYGRPLSYPDAKNEGKPFEIKDIPFGKQGIFGNHLAYARWYATQWALRIMDVVDNYNPDFIYTDGNDLFPFSGKRSGSGYKCDAAARVVADFYNKGESDNQSEEKLAVIKFQSRCPGVATTFEGSFADGIKTDQPWMGDNTVGDWYYAPGFHYDSRMVIIQLLEHVSRGGNMTLCVSLTPEGGLDQGSTTMLREIGCWMQQHGEGIYGSRAWKVFGESRNGKTRVQPHGKLGRKHADFQFQPGDYRFTVGGDGSLYVWALCPPQTGEEFTVCSLGRKAGLLECPIKQVTRVGEEEPLHWRREDEGLHIRAPRMQSSFGVQGYRIQC